MTTDLTRQLDLTVRDFAETQRVPGLQVAVATRSGLALSAGFGEADVEHATPVHRETSFRLASISKPLTAAAVLRLVDKGALALDAPASAYVPDLAAHLAPLTARQLLAHLGGVRHYKDDAEVETIGPCASLREGLAVVADEPLAHPPGTKYLYSTFGYTLLGMIAEAASGKAFGDLLADEVFAPSGMRRTRVDDPHAVIPYRARGYVRNERGELRNSKFVCNSYKVPGGGLVATADDLVAFAQGLLEKRLLTPETVTAMWTPHAPRDTDGTEYALGWILATRGGRREVYHTGGQHQVSTVLYMIPEEGFVAAVLTNLETAGPLALARRLADVAAT